jgi:transcriptional regulator with XRE-family HTH domain
MTARRGKPDFDSEAFSAKIDFLINEYCNGNAAQFNEVIGQKKASYRWKTEGHFPRVEALMKICNNFNVSIDWLLGLKEEAEEPKKESEISKSTQFLDNKELLQLLNYYKEIAGFYKDLYTHLRVIMDRNPNPCRGAEAETV